VVFATVRAEAESSGSLGWVVLCAWFRVASGFVTGYVLLSAGRHWRTFVPLGGRGGIDIVLESLLQCLLSIFISMGVMHFLRG